MPAPEPPDSFLSDEPRTLSSQLTSNPIVLGLDLAFTDQALEKEFIESHNRSQVFYDLVLAVGIRAVGWIGTALKTYLRGNTQTAIYFLCSCMPSGLLPAFGMLLSYKHYISTFRPFWVTAANLIQFLQVGRFYGHLYPCTGSGCDEALVPRAKALTALFSSNGAMFLVMTAFMGNLAFKWMFITQCIYCLVLIVSNRNICLRGPALRGAYNWIHGQLVNPFFSTLTGNFWPSASTTSLYSAAKVIASSTALHSKTDSTTPPTELSVERCIGSQAAFQLIFGLWIPCWIAYGREVQARKSFLRSRRGDSAYSNAIFPSKWEMFMCACLPAVAFPWCMFILSGTHLEY
ncbi:hypothetical protein Ndes2526B_g03601 [Nannochloris sp. 'desiccata']|nr:hypothetical protein NADE_005342 [Chlorella desiccata (nom. nud.)]